jgi:hypothetical protein
MIVENQGGEFLGLINTRSQDNKDVNLFVGQLLEN